MESVKNILLFLGKVILNIAGIAAGLYLYKTYVKPITLQTIAPEYFQEIIAVSLLIIGLPLLSMKKLYPVNLFNFGIMGLVVPAVLYGIFALNQHSSAHSYKRLFPIDKKVADDKQVVVTVYVYEMSDWINYTIPKDDCTRLDSVEIKIIDGHLGMKILTDEVTFRKKPECGS